MSLALIQGYSSAEEEADDVGRYAVEEEDRGDTSSSSGDVDGGREVSFSRRHRLMKSPKPPSPSGLLPSALDAFSEIAGPPDFLNNCVIEAGESHDSPRETGRRGRNRGRKNGRDKKDLPYGVVLEAKAQLVGIRDRVRSDIDGNHPPTSGSTITTSGESKRVVTATNPEPKDAAELLRMCLQCGIPKTYSHTRGMVCPVCSDRPPADPDSLQEKKKGSTIKDKEKNKRMKGQSSHSSWKSETEMHLRQQFD